MTSLGFALGAIGAMGAELLDRFIGRSLEAYCRLRGKRERYGEVLDYHHDAARAAEYLRVIGTVLFIMGGTLSITLDELAESVDLVSINSRMFAWTVTATLVVMFTHIWLPSAVTRFASSPVLYRTWRFWLLLSRLMKPLTVPGTIVEIIARRITGQKEQESEAEELLEDEIRTIVAAGTREGHFSPGVRDMIQGVMELHDDSVHHVMTPRSDVDAIEINTSWPEALRFVAESGRTRLPVYRETLDHIEGVLYVKDLLLRMSDPSLEDVNLSDMLRKPWMVPESKRVDELLQEFLHSRSHMAIVVDEFRQVTGVVTIEDALEELLGEIVDESDEEEQIEFIIRDESTVDVSGRLMIDQINEQLGWELQELEDYETIAGFVLHHIGYIPIQNETLEVGPLEITILRATTRQIEKLRLRRVGQSSLEAG